ncbi:hypothetical protein CYY_002551 [Polysphondylium violaceum]|uniref:Right handed beta helix domain-containing protein n=1 Tax=Polysphondylium violaceum TaxID=133409 RepID=A0A8J4PZY7_9MYCE|nr:hypothetical protein CYY_002551 [Polysphondylium violaceum]
MNKFVYLFLFVALLSGALNALGTAYYVTPNTVDNYNPVECGLSSNSPCLSILDAVYSFLNETSTTNTTNLPFVINLLPGTYLATNQSYGIHNTINPTGLDMTIQSWDPTTNAIANTPVRFNGKYYIETSLFNGNKVNRTGPIDVTTLTFNNIAFENFSTSVVQMSGSGTIKVNINNCNFTTLDMILPTFWMISNTKSSSQMTISNCYFTNNQGSLISTFNTNLNIQNSTFSLNQGDDLISIQNSNLNVTNTILDSNKLSGSYYVLKAQNSKVNMYNNQITNNTGASGIIYLLGSQSQINNTRFVGNNPTLANYGPLFLYQSYSYINNCVFTQNSGTYGGGLYSSISSVQITSSNFTNNFGTTGSQIYQYGSSIRIINSSVYSSTNQVRPNSIVYLSSTKAIFTNSSFSVGTTVMTNSGFTLFGCSSSSVYYTSKDTVVINNGYPTIYCSGCSTYVTDGSTNNSSSLIYCKKSESSSSDNSHSRPEPIRSVMRKVLISLIIFFSVVLLIAVLIIITCLVKQRRHHHSQGYTPLSQS